MQFAILLQPFLGACNTVCLMTRPHLIPPGPKKGHRKGHTPSASCVGRSSLSSIFSAYGSLSFCSTAWLKSSSPIKYFPVRRQCTHFFLTFSHCAAHNKPTKFYLTLRALCNPVKYNKNTLTRRCRTQIKWRQIFRYARLVHIHTHMCLCVCEGAFDNFFAARAGGGIQVFN